MLIIVQIPCLNEEKSLAKVIESVPASLPGADGVEVLLINDGSTDKSLDEARRAGVSHLVSFSGRRGLARAFDAGMDAALRLGADVIVNIDADGQYAGEDIGSLVAPILAGEADVTVGDRGIPSDPSYPPVKKALQAAGSWTVRRLSGTDVIDASSGFRAYSREAAMRLHLVSDFTYTLESLIQAGSDSLAVKSVPIRAREVNRPSRLFSSIPEYLSKSAATLVRVYSMYQPLKVFSALGGVIFASGFAIGIWFLYYFISEGGKGHVQLLILAAVLLIIGFQVMVMALLADLIGANRKLLGQVLFRLKRMESEKAETRNGSD